MGFFSSLFVNNDNTQLLEVIKEGAYLVDVRSAGEFSSGSVKGATNIPLESLANHIVKLKGKKSIVVFCRSGNRSSMAKSLLEQGGLKNVLNGGTWQNVNKLVNSNN